MPPRQPRDSAQILPAQSATTCYRPKLVRNREILRLMVRRRIKPSASPHCTPSFPLPPLPPVPPPLCIDLPGGAGTLFELAVRIVGVVEGDVGLSGAPGVADSLNDGLLVRALDAFEPVVSAYGRHLTLRRQQCFFTWMVRDALGVQKEVDGSTRGPAETAGARLLKQARKVRAADARRDAAARDAKEGHAPWFTL